MATIQVAQNQKQTSTEGLAKLLKLKIAEKVMLAINLYIENRLINSQTGNIWYIEFAQSSIRKGCIKFS